MAVPQKSLNWPQFLRVPPFRGQFAARKEVLCSGVGVSRYGGTGGDWPKVWTRWKGPRKQIVDTKTLITRCRWGGTGRKAASQAGPGLRRRNIFCRLFITASRKPWDGLGITQKA